MNEAAEIKPFPDVKNPIPCGSCGADLNEPGQWLRCRQHYVADIKQLRIDLEAKTAEVTRLNAIISGDESDLLDQWLAKDGPEAHAVHLAGVEHETELGKMSERLEAWRDMANIGCHLMSRGASGEFTYVRYEEAINKARALDTAAETEPTKVTHTP